MLFQKHMTTKPRKARLALERLSDRLTPAVYKWVGTAGMNFDNWTNPAAWVNMEAPGQPNDGYPGFAGSDWALFEALEDNHRKPKIIGGTEISLAGMWVYGTWEPEIVVDGVLTIRNSIMTGPAALKGEGTVNYSAIIPETLPNVPNHTVGGSFGVKTKHAHVSGWLSFSGSGQIGYDAGGGGTWDVMADGLMDLMGSHALGSNVDVHGGFRTPGPVGAALVHAGWENPGAFNLKSFNVDGEIASLTVAAGVNFSLTGTKFTQRLGGTTTLNASASLSVGDNTAYANGGTSYDKNVDVSSGTVRMYPTSSVATANGDIRFSGGADLDIYCPGSWQVGGVPHTGTVEVTAGVMTARTLTFIDAGTQINFKDYTPAGATNVTQNGVTFLSFGNLAFGANSAISQRIADGFFVGGNCDIHNTATLSISGTPPASGGVPFPWMELQCANGTLTGTFGSISDPPAGWEWSPGSPLYHESYLSIAWQEVP